jgi:hypothetical protein
MPPDRVLALTWRNFATLFFLVAVVTVPLHVARTFTYRKVLVVRELAPDIEAFPAGREVRGIGPSDLDAARRSLLVVSGIELALIPLAVGAVRRVLQIDRRAGVPTVTDAWLHALGSWAHPTDRPPPTAAGLVVGLAVGLAAGFLVGRAGILLAETVPNYLAFAPLGVVEGTARALSAIFFLVPLALLVPRAKAKSHVSRPQ